MTSDDQRDECQPRKSNRKEVLVPSRTHRRRTLVAGAGLAAVAVAGLLVAGASDSSAKTIPDRSKITASPIKHLVVIFDENVSYDHYFGTYPKAKNTDGTPFYAVSSTPKNNNLVSANLLQSNPNLYSPSGSRRARPSPATRTTTTGQSRRPRPTGR